MILYKRLRPHDTRKMFIQVKLYSHLVLKTNPDKPVRKNDDYLKKQSMAAA